MPKLLRLLALLLVTLPIAGCELIVDIFQFGLVVGIIIVLLIVGVIAWAVRKFRG